MRSFSRRELLASGCAATTGTLASVSGCLSILDEDTGDSGRSLRPMEWLYPPDTANERRYRYTHWDVGTIEDGSGNPLYPSGSLREWPTLSRTDFDRILWGDPSEIEEFLLVNQPIYSFAYGHASRAIRFNSAQVIRGSDAYHQTARSNLEDYDWDQYTYEGFDVYVESEDHAAAVGEIDGTPLLVRSNFSGRRPLGGEEVLERLVDTHTGPNDHLQDTDPVAGRVQERLSDGGIRVGTAGSPGRFERLLQPIDREGSRATVRRAGLDVEVDGDAVRFELVLATSEAVGDANDFVDQIPLLETWEDVEAASHDEIVTCQTQIPTRTLTETPNIRDYPETEFEFEFDMAANEVTVRYVGGWSIPAAELVVFLEGDERTRIYKVGTETDLNTVTTGDAVTISFVDELRGGYCSAMWGAWRDSTQFSLAAEILDQTTIPE